MPYKLFSAYAEVFLSPASSASRRCPLFSAYAEVFPCLFVASVGHLSFLCLRRGVSDTGTTSDDGIPFSPPTQRCFVAIQFSLAIDRLFSAYAEVFPLLPAHA